ncbi:molybdopterin synthase subunit MoaD [Marinobacter daqiaonensis]|uniref:Molybdopterin synthase sulfur carrier subunit n=1 Tax=Marinobacter daqiaonensis TaxID=650891 RepID=A0A1I6I2A7_9GAMM|nr:molybdopterin converting factor subunit 1 [Marinobacter daqiaonensis]SFR60768.1 molybdopterin synthase subunit MoaD [Marinobacter daqiaonensis]
MATDTITVRYFARLREELGTDSEVLALDAEQRTAGDLLNTLAERGGPWRQLAGDQPVMIAVNQAMARPHTRVGPGDEVAFFPPVTGG